MNKLETLEEKIKFLNGIFNYYQPTLTIPEQIALLSIWEEVLVIEEEYEIAEIIKNKIITIQQDPDNTPQKGLVTFETVEEKPKPSFFKKIFFWFKNKLS